MDIGILRLFIGIGMIFFGRKLFWGFIGAAGFIIGMSASQSIIHDQSIWFHLIAGVALGIVLVLLVKFLKNFAFGVGGFVLGAYLANGVLTLTGLNLGTISWVVVLVGGILGAVLMLTLFDWALIILSSTVGAMLITQSVPKDMPGVQILFFGLVLLGMIVQVKRNRPLSVQKTLPKDIAPEVNPPSR